MKKFTFTGLLTALMLFAGTTFGQEVIISDGFEDYADGAALVEAAHALGRDHWIVWGDDPGSAIDATVTTSQKFEGTKSMRVDTDDDVVLLLGDQTAGKFRISFQVYVPTGRSGYFNVLHKYTGGQGSEWVIDVFLNANGSTNTIVAGENLTSATYPKDTWFPVVLDFDLNNDLAVFTMNNAEVYEWKFSLIGSTGNQGLRQLAAVDFYGNSTVYGSSTPTETNEAYFDQIVFELIEEPIPPTVVISVDEIFQEVKPGDTGSSKVTISNEGTGGAADVACYIDFIPETSGDQEDVTLRKCQSDFIDDQNGVGNPQDLEREIAIVMSPGEYKIGSTINEIEYWINGTITNMPASDITVRIYNQGLANNSPGEVLASNVLPQSEFKAGEWNKIPIDDVTLTGGAYWISVGFFQNASTYPMSMDAGPYQTGGDWMRSQAGGSWSRLQDNSDPPILHNWAIKANGKGILSDSWANCATTYYSSIFAGTSVDLTVNFDTKNLENGEYEATLIFLTNDPENSKIEVPVVLKVSDEVLGTDASIKGIFVDGVAATLADGSDTDYWIEIKYTDKVEITIETTDPDATASGDLGEQAVIVGTNPFNFKVIAEDDIHEISYYLEINVDKKPDGIDDVEKVLISIHPNPVQDKLYFDTEKQIQNVQIFDLNGRMIQEIKVSGDAIDVKGLASGVYLVKIFTAEGNVTHKIIKK